ncbi:hypothetical protein [Bosea sp. (in: a-proteobacteria)]|uniref:hypothetical protein n=2 Tax=Alphaproteobacteria TaxID=28211 RepID=UPI0025C1BC46|nr:hypothetical protein [Bosea sp. (in: a-proteobacteria)]
MNHEVRMARTLEQERAALAQDEQRLADRRKQLEDREREEAIRACERSGLLKLDPRRLESLAKRIRTLGLDEVEKRLTA